MIEDITYEKTRPMDASLEDEEILEENEDGEEEEVSSISDKNFEQLDLSNRSMVKTKSLEEPLVLEFKTLPTHLKYAYLGEESTLPVIISPALSPNREKALL